VRSQSLLVASVSSLFVLVGAWYLLRGAPVEGPALRDPAATTATEAGSSAPVAPATAEAPAPNATLTAAGPAEAARTLVNTDAGAAGRAACTVSGRLVDLKGAPRADVEVRWRSWKLDGDLIALSLPFGDRDRDRPQDKVRTDRDGRFLFPLDKGRQGSLQLDLDHYVFQRGEVGFATTNGDAALGDLTVVLPSHLRGVVVDGHGQPVADVMVGVTVGNLGLGTRSESKTDAQGRFDVGALHAGKWTLRTMSARHLPAVLEMTLADEEQKDDVRLVVDQGRSIAGQIVDDRGMPVAGMKVGSMRKEQRGAMSIERFVPDEAATTDDGGYFVLGGLQGEVVTVRASGRGHSMVTEANVAVGTGNLLLRTMRRGSVAGVLTDLNGKPIAGSRVSARGERRGGPVPVPEDIDIEDEIGPELAGPRASATTAEDGSFKIDDVDPGTVTVRARGKTHRPAQQAGIVVAPAQTVAGIALKAETGALVAATVVDEDGAPVADAKVEVRRPKEQPSDGSGGTFSRRVRVDANESGDQDIAIGGGPQQLGTATTTADGRAEIGGLPVGAAIVTCSHEKFADAQPLPAVLPAQGSVEVRLVLRRPGNANLTVTLPNGTGAAAHYVVHGPVGVFEDERDRSGTTGTDGTARVLQLPAGDYWAELRLSAKPREFGGGMMVLADDDHALPGTRVPFHVDAGRDADVALRLPILTRVHGTVTGADGPAKDVAIELAEERGGAGAAPPGFEGQHARTGEDGTFELTDVMPGRYRLRWGKAEQIVKASMMLDVPANQPELQRDLELHYGKVRVQVVAKDGGEPIEGVEVELAEADAAGGPPRQQRRMMMISMRMDGDNGETTSMTMGGARATTDVDGVAEIGDVPPGRYTVKLRHDRFAPREIADQSVLEHQTTDCGRVDLATAGRIRGRVLAADGKPANMALVTCQKVGDSGEPQRQPSMNGAFSFTGLAPGRYSLQAQRLGPDRANKPGDPVEVEVTGGKTASGVEVRLPAN